MNDQDDLRSDRLLKAALVFTLIAHGVAMVSMAALLLPGVPGGGQANVAERASYVANNPWLWRLGWLPWQITAASDLLLGFALVRTRWIPRLPAILALLATVAGACFDQTGEFLWTWRGVEEATRAVATGEFEPYLRFETYVFGLTAGYGPVGYLIGAICWTWCFAGARVGSRLMLWAAIAAWTLFAIGTAPMFLRDRLHLGDLTESVVSVCNAVGFVLLMVWLTGITEAVFRRSSPDSAYGTDAPWRRSESGVIASASGVIANSRLMRAFGHCVTPLRMASDVADVVYVNYLVEASCLDPLVQRPLELQRLGPSGRYALFTVLTFRHEHFGPTCFGRWRRLWPSPIQSNWRIHVVNPRTGTRGIQFLTTAITSTPHALATRLLTDGVHMHVPASAELHRHDDGSIELSVDGGRGTAPSIRGRFMVSASEPTLAPPWSECFSSWRELLEYCVPQEQAMAVNASGRVMRQEIELNIPLDECRPASGDVESGVVRQIAGDASPLCFVVNHLDFRFTGQHWDR